MKTGTLHENPHTFIVICRRILLRMRNISDKSCKENQNTLFVFSNFFPKIVTLIMWKNVVERVKSQVTI